MSATPRACAMLGPDDRAGRGRIAARFEAGGATGSDDRVVVAGTHVAAATLNIALVGAAA